MSNKLYSRLSEFLIRSSLNKHEIHSQSAWMNELDARIDIDEKLHSSFAPNEEHVPNRFRARVIVEWRMKREHRFIHIYELMNMIAIWATHCPH